MGANSPMGPGVNQNREYASTSPKKTVTKAPSFLKKFTWERFSKSPDKYRKQITQIVNAQLRQIDATVGLLRYAKPELNQLKRDLGLLHIKCLTFYERFVFNRCLRENANDILGSFDLSSGKSLDDSILEVPPLIRDSLRLYQIRWRNAVAASKWQKDFTKCKEELIVVREQLANCDRELERKKTQLEMYKKICAVRDEFHGLTDEEKLKKIESVLGIKAPPQPSSKEDNSDRRRSFSEGSLESLSSDDDSSWDELWLGTQTNKEMKPA